MTRPFDPRGAFTALVTPFSGDDASQIDEGAFRQLVEFQVAEGITGIVPCGTTGESPTLDWSEHKRLIEIGVEVAADRVSVLAGTGSNSTVEAIDASRHARDVGAGAGLLVDCYYNGPSSLELREDYYERVLEAVPGFAIVPYVIPGRSGCALSAVDLAQLHLNAPDRVVAVKQATGDFERMAEDRALAGEGLAILSGDDELTLVMMRDQAIGCSGVISVMTNLAPRAVTEMVAAQAAGNEERATELQVQLAPLFGLVGCAVDATRTLPDGRELETVDKFRNPSPVKTMMAGLGMIPAGTRAPLGLMSEAGVASCRAALTTVHQSAPDVLAPIEEAFGVQLTDRLADDDVWSALTR